LEPLIQSIGTLAVAVIPFVVTWIDQQRRTPNRIEKKTLTPALASAAELPMGVVLKTSAINAELLQQVFAQNNAISAELNVQSEKIDSMEKQINKLKTDNQNKTRKITKLERRVRQLEEEMKRHNIEIPPEVTDATSGTSDGGDYGS
jgi:chromosome segregation ATPase